MAYLRHTPRSNLMFNCLLLVLNYRESLRVIIIIISEPYFLLF